MVPESYHWNLGIHGHSTRFIRVFRMQNSFAPKSQPRHSRPSESPYPVVARCYSAKQHNYAGTGTYYLVYAIHSWWHIICLLFFIHYGAFFCALTRTHRRCGVRITGGDVEFVGVASAELEKSVLLNNIPTSADFSLDKQ